MKRTRAMLVAAAVAVGSFGMSQGVTLAQEAAGNAAKQQQAEQKRQEREARQAERQARRAERGEREQLQNMPKPAREALTAQVGQGTSVDYYKIAEGEQRVFGATFTDAAGETIDVRVDRDGKVLSRMSSAQAAAAAAQQPAAAGTPGTAAPATPAPATPAPATPAAPPTYNPADLTAAAKAHQGHRLDQIPAGPQAVLREETKGATGVGAEYFRALNGKQEVWEAKFTTADGKDMLVHVNDAGQVVERREIKDVEEKKRTEVKFDKMPDNVKDRFREVTRGHEGAQFYTNTWNGQQVYETMYWEKDQRWVVRLDASGKEVDRQVLKNAKRVSDYKDKDDDDKKDKKDRKNDDRK